MLEYFQIRLAPMLILIIFGGLFLSLFLASKIDETKFRSKSVYSMVIYSPYLLGGLFFMLILFLTFLKVKGPSSDGPFTLSS